LVISSSVFGKEILSNGGWKISFATLPVDGLVLMGCNGTFVFSGSSIQLYPITSRHQNYGW
jgi:hypothetical protein